MSGVNPLQKKNKKTCNLKINVKRQEVMKLQGKISFRLKKTNFLNKIRYKFKFKHNMETVEQRGLQKKQKNFHLKKKKVPFK